MPALAAPTCAAQPACAQEQSGWHAKSTDLQGVALRSDWQPIDVRMHSAWLAPPKETTCWENSGRMPQPSATAAHPGSLGWRPHSQGAPAPRRTAQSSSEAQDKWDKDHVTCDQAELDQPQATVSPPSAAPPKAAWSRHHKCKRWYARTEPTWGPYRKKPIMNTVAHCSQPMEAGTAANAISMAAMPSVYAMMTCECGQNRTRLAGQCGSVGVGNRTSSAAPAPWATPVHLVHQPATTQKWTAFPLPWE